MGPVSYNSVKNQSLKCLPIYLHCCVPHQSAGFQLLLLFLSYFSFTHQVKKPHRHREKLANYSSKTVSKRTVKRELVEKSVSLASPALYVTKKIIHLFSPNQGNTAFTAKMLFGAVLLCQAAPAERAETFNTWKLKQAIKHSNTGLQLIKQE